MLGSYVYFSFALYLVKFGLHKMAFNFFCCTICLAVVLWFMVHICSWPRLANVLDCQQLTLILASFGILGYKLVQAVIEEDWNPTFSLLSYIGNVLTMRASIVVLIKNLYVLHFRVWTLTLFRKGWGLERSLSKAHLQCICLCGICEVTWCLNLRVG